MELEKLFSTFHDFDIIGIDSNDGRLVMTFRIPWGEMWDDFDFQIKVAFSGGQILGCKYFEWVEGTNSAGQPNSIDKETTDYKTIAQLGIDIQRFKSCGDDKYVFFCNGYDKVGGAELLIKANNFLLFDSEDKPIGTKEYQTWHNDWRTSLQKN